MQMILKIKILILFFVLTGCVRHLAYYDIDLKEVERPAKAKERYGEQKISKISEGGIDRYYFEDEMVKIIWLVSPIQISFDLTNKTEHSIKIIWDEAAYLDEKGASHRVMHSGVKYIDRNNSQPPSIIIKKGSIDDIIIPTDKVYFVAGESGGWNEEQLFPPVPGNTLEELNANAKTRIGNNVKVLLPLQIQDVINEYLFTFEVKNVVVR